MTVKRPMCLICTLILLFLFLLLYYEPPEPGPNTVKYSDREVILWGRIKTKETKNDNIVITLKDVTIADIDTTNQNGEFNSRGIVLYISGDVSFLNSIKLNAEVVARGKLALFSEPENEGEFDQRKYYAIRGIEGVIYDAKIIATSKDYSLYRENLWRIRTNTANLYDKFMDERYSGCLKAIILGDKTELDSDIKTIFQRAGISHILALSGLHIAAVGMALLKLLKKLRIGEIPAVLLSSVIMISYAVMTGLSTSSYRALIMFIICVFADVCNRSYDLISSACLACVLIVCENPYYLYDTGFLLSFGAILGIGVVMPILLESLSALTPKWLVTLRQKRRREELEEVENVEVVCEKNGTVDGLQSIEHGKKYVMKPGVKYSMKYTTSYAMKFGKYISEKVWKLVIDGVLASVSVSLVIIPITAYSFYVIPLYSVFANLLVIPIMGTLLFLGFAGSFVGYLVIYIFDVGESVVGKMVAGILFSLSEKILQIYEKIGNFFARLRGNNFVVGKPGAINIICYYILLVIGLIVLCKLMEVRNVLASFDLNGHGKDKKNSRIFRWITKSISSHRKGSKIILKSRYDTKNRKNKQKIKKMTHIVNYVILVNLISMFSLVLILSYRKQSDVEIRNISVGQGDSCLISGKNTPVILIDGGSTSKKNVGTYQISPVILSNGISFVDYVFVTHPDEDHINGIIEILEDEYSSIEVGKVIISDTAMRYYKNFGESDLLSDLIYLASIKNIPVYSIGANDVIKPTDSKCIIRCLSPFIEDNQMCITENVNLQKPDNDSSIVLYIEYPENDYRALFTGDITSEAEDKILKEYGDDIKNVDYLKVAHHGSKYSSASDYLNIVNPGIAVISAGKNNSYGHPHRKTLERLNETRAKVICTIDVGEVITKVR